VEFSANDFGYALVILSLVFAVASLIRRKVNVLRSLFIPTAVIGGFVALALGPEGIGHLTDGNGVFADKTFAVWVSLPGLLINVMCASLLLGEKLPPLPQIWKISGSHVITAGIMSFGQYAVGAILVLLIINPVFGLTDKAAVLIEMSFAGGHGTLAGLTPVLHEYNVEELLEIGLGLATIGMVTGIVFGTILVNYAVKSPKIEVARDKPTVPEENYDIDYHEPTPDDPPINTNRGMAQVTAAAVFLGVSIALGMVLLGLMRWIFGLFGSDFFNMFPLFPFTIIGGVLVQLAATRFDFEWAVNRQAVEGLGGLAVDGIVICAIGTLSLSALGDQIGPLLVLAVGSVVWSMVVTMIIGPKVFARNWFEHAIAEFGESQGNVATGFVMVDMVDPNKHTDVVRGYGYRQLVTRPILGGGFITALSIPLVAAMGITAFTIVTVALTALFIFWGIRHAAAIKAAS